MAVTPIQEQLFALQDKEYQSFHSRLIPNIRSEYIIGVRMPAVRRLAKTLYQQGDYDAFLHHLPHTYYEENNLHGALICEMRDYATCIAALDRFLPYVDNWATCDILRPKAFATAAKQHSERLLTDIQRWLHSDAPYTIRFGIEMLMTYYLDNHDEQSDSKTYLDNHDEPCSSKTTATFRAEYLDWAAQITHNHYYVRMMVAWFFATALAKQYEATLPYIEQHRLPAWTHQKTIQKAIESFRITAEQKAYLRQLN